MGYIKQKLWVILGKNKGMHLAKAMGYIGHKLFDSLGKTYGIFWAKTMSYIMEYSRQNL